jgi:hypothetical protein
VEYSSGPLDSAGFIPSHRLSFDKPGSPSEAKHLAYTAQQDKTKEPADPSPNQGLKKEMGMLE